MARLLRAPIIVCAVVTFLVALGCGDTGSVGSKASLKLTNQYAESLFTVSYAPLGMDGTPGDTVMVATEERIDGFRSMEYDDVFIVTEGQSKLRINLTARSLGDDRSFDPVDTEFMRGKTFEIIYDYDLANAAFHITGGWR